MSLQQELDKYFKSKSFQDKVNLAIKTDKDFGKGINAGGTEALAKYYASIMEQYVYKYISYSQSRNFIRHMKDSIITEAVFISGTGWIVNIYFDPEIARSESWYLKKYPNGAYLPTLFNNGYSATNYVYKYIGEGVYARSRLSRKAEYFIQKAVKAFNIQYSANGIKAQYNEIYDRNGIGKNTFSRGDLATDVF